MRSSRKATRSTGRRCRSGSTLSALRCVRSHTTQCPRMWPVTTHSPSARGLETDRGARRQGERTGGDVERGDGAVLDALLRAEDSYEALRGAVEHEGHACAVVSYATWRQRGAYRARCPRR